MHIDAAKPRQVEHVLPQDLPEGGDHDQVRLQRFQFGEGLRSAQLRRLYDRDAELFGQHFYRGRG